MLNLCQEMQLKFPRSFLLNQICLYFRLTSRLSSNRLHTVLSDYALSLNYQKLHERYYYEVLEVEIERQVKNVNKKYEKVEI